MANVLATFAQFEQWLISPRTREALAVKREKGVVLGRPPSVDDAVVRRIARERRRGRSLHAIAESLNTEGVPTGQGGKRWYAGPCRRSRCGGAADEQEVTTMRREEIPRIPQEDG
jgi:recombinase